MGIIPSWKDAKLLIFVLNDKWLPSLEILIQNKILTINQK